jgi:hypothetical protein
MLDNASNNDTMVEGIDRRAKLEGIKLNASWARLRCMPHTIHLAAIKVKLFSFYISLAQCHQLLEAIGAISKSNAPNATSRNGNYQDSTTAPLSRTHDDEAAGQDDEEQLGDVILTPDASGNILLAVDKVSHPSSHSCMQN